MTTLESEQEMTRTEVATYLREFAAQLDTTEPVSESPTLTGADDDERITFMIGTDSHTINPPETVLFEVETGSDSSFVGSQTEHEVEFELSWKTEPAGEDEEADELEIK